MQNTAYHLCSFSSTRPALALSPIIYTTVPNRVLRPRYVEWAYLVMRANLIILTFLR